MKTRITFFLGLLLGWAGLHAQTVDLLPDHLVFETELNYAGDITSPAEFLGYELGTRFTEYEKTVNYARYLAASSDRILYNEYGQTYEGRPLINLVISSEENIRNIDAIRARHQSLVDGTSRQDPDRLIANEPVFTSFSYNIHGNEASSTEAAMQVAYRLAAAQDPAMDEVLSQSVIIMYICINPDGRDRYVYWINGVGRQLPGTNPDDLEHYAPWPNGRTNHYWFDLNRDWLWGVHPESRGHTAEYLRWMPQVHVDYHEQGYNANYFTAPGTTPRNLLLPTDYEAWSDTFGRANIAEFDKLGLSYFTRDRFDFFYPGYGSSYPSVMGAIGMLVEQGGIGAGRAVTTEDGFVLTFRQRIYDHYTTSLATIRKAAERRRELLAYSLRAWDPDHSLSENKAYFIRQDEGGYVTDVIRILLHQGVEVQRATGNFSVRDAKDYWDGTRKAVNFSAGDYIISADQPRHLFVHSLLQRNLAIEDSVMYDMATWSAPLAYNLEAYSSRQVASYPAETVDMDEVNWGGRISLTAEPYAFVIDWDQRWAPRALAMLWEKGYRVRAAVEPFGDEAHTFSAGSLIILRGRNLEKSEVLRADMAEIAEQAGVTVVAKATGRMLDGYDLASTRNVPVDQPKVAMLVEPPFDTYTAGQVYFLFDQDTRLPVDRIRTSVLQQTALPRFGSRYGYADLNDYDVLILPDARINALKEVFNGNALESLKDWLRRGGTIVAMEGAAGFFTAETKFNELVWAGTDRDTSEEARRVTYGERERYYGLQRIPGSALQGHIDTTNPLGFGLDPRVYTLRSGSDALAPDANLQAVGTYGEDSSELLVAGYASASNLDHLRAKVFAGVSEYGQGKIVYLVDNPHFRMFWRGPSRLMQNAVMLVPGF